MAKKEGARVIMHLDMDAFFVNVELLARPDLRGLPLIVAPSSARSVVTSASYEARAYGVRSAMPLTQARRLCPQAVVLPPAGDYRGYSRQIMQILQKVSPLVEQVSVDEAFLDLTGRLGRGENPVDIAQATRQEILDTLGLPSSVGLAPSKLLAKMASDGSKPQGLWVIPPARVQDFLDPLPVSQLWGVGAKTSAALAKLGIRRVEQLRSYDLSYLQARFGQAQGLHLYRMARGLDDRPVTPYREEKSIGAEHTFEQDLSSRQELLSQLYRLSLEVARRLRARGKQAASLSLKIRYSDFETVTRSCPLEVSSSSGYVFYEALSRRLGELGVVGSASLLPRPLRLVGVRAEKLEDQGLGVQGQLLGVDLEPEGEPVGQTWLELEQTMDTIRGRFGPAGLRPASLLPGEDAARA